MAINERHEFLYQITSGGYRREYVRSLTVAPKIYLESARKKLREKRETERKRATGIVALAESEAQECAIRTILWNLTCAQLLIVWCSNLISSMGPSHSSWARRHFWDWDDLQQNVNHVPNEWSQSSRNKQKTKVRLAATCLWWVSVQRTLCSFISRPVRLTSIKRLRKTERKDPTWGGVNSTHSLLTFTLLRLILRHLAAGTLVRVLLVQYPFADNVHACETFGNSRVN